MTCHDCTERLDDFDDGRLASEEAAAVRQHLDTCTACRALETDVARIRAAARNLGPIEPPAGAWAQMAAAVGAHPWPGAESNPVRLAPVAGGRGGGGAGGVEPDMGRLEAPAPAGNGPIGGVGCQRTCGLVRGVPAGGSGLSVGHRQPGAHCRRSGGARAHRAGIGGRARGPGCAGSDDRRGARAPDARAGRRDLRRTCCSRRSRARWRCSRTRWRCSPSRTRQESINDENDRGGRPAAGCAVGGAGHRPRTGTSGSRHGGLAETGPGPRRSRGARPGALAPPAGDRARAARGPGGSWHHRHRDPHDETGPGRQRGPGECGGPRVDYGPRRRSMSGSRR